MSNVSFPEDEQLAEKVMRLLQDERGKARRKTLTEFVNSQ